jgi:hypothetical protein
VAEGGIAIIGDIMEIEIIDAYELETLATIAKNNKLTTEQYATNIVRGWVQDQIKGMYINYARTKSIEEIKNKIGKLIVKEA